MSNKTLNLTTDLYQYVLDTSLREDSVLNALRAETAKLAEKNMQIAPEQGQFMALLLKLIGAKRVIEVGTFTGYSALAMALALPDDGEIHCCDISTEWTDVGQRYWKEAGVEHKVHLHIAPAIDTLEKLIVEETATFDAIFIDADKENYQQYFDLGLELLCPNGVLMIDNTLWDGQVINSEDQSESTQAIREFNQRLHTDKRVDISLLPMSDGLTLARKKESV